MSGLSWLAHRWTLALLSVGILTLAIAACVSWLAPPVPSVHDEFSYLLAADTFRQGRLTNPTHPLWRHFETFHVIQQPTYASKYPPGQGLMLALGAVLTGLPIAGAWLATAMAAMATCWMLAGWLPRRFATVGGLLVALHAGIQLGWGQSFWGGSLAMVGGALVFGAVPRITRLCRCWDGVLLGGGVALLSVTRPFEGVIVCACAGVAICSSLFCALRNSPDGWRAALTKFARPLIGAMGVVLPALAFLGYYNMQVTGHPLRLPYAVHEAAYGISPLFVWQSPRPEPEYRHAEIAAFYRGWGLDAYRAHRSPATCVQMKLDGTLALWAFFLGPALTLTLVALPALLRDRRLRFAWCGLAALFAGSLCVFWMLPHYFAPAAPLVVLVVVQGLRHLRAAAQRKLRAGNAVVVAIVLLQAALLATGVVRLVRNDGQSWAHQRANIAAQLERTPGRHLVIVGYRPDHNVHAEWVYNAADIDGSPVVWARSLGPQRDAELARHFADRHLWRLDGDSIADFGVSKFRAISESPARQSAIRNPKSAIKSPPKAVTSGAFPGTITQLLHTLHIP